MSQTEKYQLFTTSDATTNFRAWREAVAGDNDSNMTKIEAALVDIQDQINGFGVVVDDELSDTSVNPVQNKVIKHELDNHTHDYSKLTGLPTIPDVSGKQDKITAEGLLKGDGNGGISAAVAGTDYLTSHQDLSGKQDKITTNGLLKCDGDGGVSAAVAGTDFVVPSALDNYATTSSLDNYVTTDSLSGQFDGKADKSVSLALTLTASGWTGSAAPWVQTLAATGLGANQNGSIAVAMTATPEQRESARNALLSVTGQSEGAITITADGTKPTINIPVTLVMQG